MFHSISALSYQVVHFQPADPVSRHQLIGRLEAAHPVRDLCRPLGVSRTAYYRWRRGGSHNPSASRQAQAKRVEAVFWEHRRRYGSRRITAELNQRGEKTGRHRVRTLMKQQGLQPSRCTHVAGSRLCPRPLIAGMEGVTALICCLTCKACF